MAMFLTATIETLLLYFLKYRDWKILSYFFSLNLISNLCVNVIYSYVCHINPLGLTVALLELGVLLFEITLLGLMSGYNKKLYLSVFATNLCTFLLGVLLFGL